LADHHRRVVELTGVGNVRDLGGLPSASGTETVRNRLYRAAFAPELTAADIAVLTDEVGLRFVADLRSDAEVLEAPGALRMPDLAWAHFPLPVDASAILGQEADYLALYLGFMERDPEPLRSALIALMDPANHPGLFHCAAGKDRTGVVSAILLDILGVPRPLIVEDYAWTLRDLRRVARLLAGSEIYRRATGSGLRAASPETINDFLTALDRRHGGAVNWLTAAGVPLELVDAFQRVASA
jgi:protein-tyrosine phosphatase